VPYAAAANKQVECKNFQAFYFSLGDLPIHPMGESTFLPMTAVTGSSVVFAHPAKPTTAIDTPKTGRSTDQLTGIRHVVDRHALTEVCDCPVKTKAPIDRIVYS
jgi:ureidoglycolate hydrolase